MSHFPAASSSISTVISVRNPASISIDSERLALRARNTDRRSVSNTFKNNGISFRYDDQSPSSSAPGTIEASAYLFSTKLDETAPWQEVRDVNRDALELDCLLVADWKLDRWRANTWIIYRGIASWWCLFSWMILRINPCDQITRSKRMYLIVVNVLFPTADMLIMMRQLLNKSVLIVLSSKTTFSVMHRQ